MKTAQSLTLALALAVGVPTASLLGAPKNKPADPAPAAPAAAAPAAPAPAAADAAAAPIPDPVAVVEGAPIKKAELDKAFTNMLASQGATPDAVPPEQKAQVYSMILNDLIIDHLLDKRSAQQKVPDEEVTKVYERFKQNFGSDEELAKQVAAHGETIDGLKGDIRSSLRKQLWIDDQIKGKVEISDAEADDYYKKNPTRFDQPEQVRASHILIQVEKDAKPEVVEEKKKQAQAIADRVKKGEDFSKLAEQLSEDPTAKENKGDLDFFSKEKMVPEFANAAFAMKKDEISDPVRSNFGFHVIKVTDRKAPETISLEQAKPQIVAQLKRQKQQDEIEKLVEGIRKTADVKVNLPDPAPVVTAKPTEAPAPDASVK